MLLAPLPIAGGATYSDLVSVGAVNGNSSAITNDTTLVCKINSPLWTKSANSIQIYVGAPPVAEFNWTECYIGPANTGSGFTWNFEAGSTPKQITFDGGSSGGMVRASSNPSVFSDIINLTDFQINTSGSYCLAFNVSGSNTVGVGQRIPYITGSSSGIITYFKTGLQAATVSKSSGYTQVGSTASGFIRILGANV